MTKTGRMTEMQSISVGPVLIPLTHRQLLLPLYNACHYIIISLGQNSHAVMQSEQALLKFGHIKNTHIELRTACSEKAPLGCTLLQKQEKYKEIQGKIKIKLSFFAHTMKHKQK